MTGLCIAHVSDLHLPFEPRLSAAQRLSKRQLSAWSWERRRHLHRPEIVQALASDIQGHAVDHVVVTGDIINFSLEDEYVQAADWLSKLAPAGKITVVPGNHDALVDVPPAHALDRWLPWTGAHGGWPTLRRLGDVALIGLNSAVPTAPLLARGRLGDRQLQALDALLEAEGREGRQRVVLIHHPPAVGAIGWRKALADGAALRAVLRRRGAELVLHGHARAARLDAIAGPGAPIPCLCVPSSSAVASRHDQGARWHRLTLLDAGEPGGPRMEVQVRRWRSDVGGFATDHTYELCLPERS